MNAVSLLFGSDPNPGAGSDAGAVDTKAVKISGTTCALNGRAVCPHHQRHLSRWLPRFANTRYLSRSKGLDLFNVFKGTWASAVAVMRAKINGIVPPYSPAEWILKTLSFLNPWVAGKAMAFYCYKTPDSACPFL